MAKTRKTTSILLGILILAASALPGIFMGLGFLPQIGNLLEGKLFVLTFVLALAVSVILYIRQFFAANSGRAVYLSTHLVKTIISTAVVLVVAGALSGALFALSLRAYVPSQALTALLVGTLSISGGHFVGRYFFHPYY